MSIIIGCDSFLSLRNIRNGNIGNYLNDTVVLVDPNQLKGSRLACPEKIRIDALIDFDARRDVKLYKRFHDIYVSRKAYYDGWTLWNAMFASVHRSYPKLQFRQVTSLVAAAARFINGWMNGALGNAKNGRKLCAHFLREHPLAKEYHSLFKNLKSEAVVGFSPEGLREMLLVEAANEAGVPTAVMIRSRDNLSAKIQHLPYARRYFVWSAATRDFLLHMYPEIDEKTVLITGSPQFDHHLNPAYRMKKEDFFSFLKLDPNRPLIVYTMATPGLIDHEIEIAQHLADAAHSGKFVRGAQLLVRGHPRMFGSDIRLLHREYPEARGYPAPTDKTFRSPGHEEEVVRLILEDEPVHLATLAYQAVQVNICGTMTIDSAIFDKPSVNIYYDLSKNIPYGLSIRRIYERSDVKNMMAYKASRLAHDPEECIHLINMYLENPSLDTEGRKRAREGDCGPLDGNAGKRIADAILELIQKKG